MTAGCILQYTVLDGKTQIINGNFIREFNSLSLLEIVKYTTFEGTNIFILVTEYKEGVIEALDSHVDCSIERVPFSHLNYFLLIILLPL